MAIKSRVGLFVLFIVVAGAAVLYAEDPSSVNLLVGRSTVIDIGTPIARVSLTSPDIADAMVTSPAQLLVHGKMPGAISMFIWDRAGAIRRYDVVVQRDLSRLATQVVDLFPGEHITVQGNGQSVVVAGTASSKFVADKAAEVAAGYVEKKEDVVNLVQVQTGAASNQVLLRVRFAEVNRSALTELGAAFIANGYKKDWFGRGTTQQYSAPVFDSDRPGGLVFSDFLNLFVYNNKEGLGAVIKALQTKGLFQSLAEPNLVAESGKEANFLAGGELPIPVAQGTGGNVAISVMWKEFGIRLNFTPTVIGDRINLKVRPEVSTLDFSNAIVVQGFRIPALSTRRAETEVELMNNQTFAIAGLMNNQMTQSLEKIPGIGDIPILGLLFKSKAARKEQTELVVMITPTILPPNSQGVTGALPRLTEPYLAPVDPKKAFPQPPVAFAPSGSGAANVTAPAGLPSASAMPSPAAAAAAVSALTPQGTKVLTTADANQPTSEDAAPVAVPVSGEERKALEQAQHEERRTHADARLQTEKQAREQKVTAQLQKERAAKDREEQERQDRLARVQKARDEKQAGLDKERSDRQARAELVQQAAEKVRQDRIAQEQARRDAEQAKRDAEAAKRQTAIDREHQKQIDEAASKLKAAELAYQTELGKRSNDQSTRTQQ